jgi:hypothetical protein
VVELQGYWIGRAEHDKRQADRAKRDAARQQRGR